MPVEKSRPVPPFTRYCAMLIPTVFDDSMTYYEALCALSKWLQDNLVNVVNNNAEITEETVKAIEELKKYVDEYFSDLNVQTEINNKLDDMAESGQLETIISIYLNSNMAVITDGYTLTSIGAKGYNTQTGCYYEVTDTVDHSHAQHEVEDGIYATVIDGAYLTKADKTVSPMSQALVSRLAHCAASYISRRNEFTYGGTYSAFRPNVQRVNGKWEINCSTFAVLMMYGIDYQHSEYNLGTGNYVADGRFCEDAEMLEWFSTPFEGAVGDHRWKYTYHLAQYMYERGYCFEPNEDLSNIRPGDVLFFKHQINGGENTTSTFREIDHSAIFGWWVSDTSCVVFDVGNLPSAGLNLISNLRDNLELVGRVATQPTNDDFKVVSYQQDPVTTNTTTLSYVRCEPFEADEFYTLLATVENTETNLDHYPVIYQGEDRLYGYDGASAKPENNFYIMPFLPSDLTAGAIRIQMNAREAGLTTPSTTLTNPIVVKGLLNSGELSVTPNRTAVLQNFQGTFSMNVRRIHGQYAIVEIAGALAQGNNYICDVLGLTRSADVVPCMGQTITYNTGGVDGVMYYLDFRAGTNPHLVAKAGSAITDTNWVKHYIIIPLIQS